MLISFFQLAVKMVELEEYKSIQEQKPKMKKADYLAAIVESTPFDTEAEFDSWIKKTEADIRKKQRKDLGEEPEVEEEPSFLLVEVPDAELNEEDLKEKRRQRLMKAGWDARVKLREEKRKEKARVVSG
jgi:actin-related protein 5